MNSGTQAAKEAGNMVDLDNDPTKLIEVVEIGKQLLITRGTLTTFSIANDVAKYFAIVPALFIASIPALQSLNIMGLKSPETAILSAIIFNAINIPMLIPLALKGVQYRPIGASALLRRNLLIYGLGGIIAPFIGIKIIDILLGMFMSLNNVEEHEKESPDLLKTHDRTYHYPCRPVSTPDLWYWKTYSGQRRGGHTLRRGQSGWL